MITCSFCDKVLIPSYPRDSIYPSIILNPTPKERGLKGYQYLSLSEPDNWYKERRAVICCTDKECIDQLKIVALLFGIDIDN